MISQLDDRLAPTRTPWPPGGARSSTGPIRGKPADDDVEVEIAPPDRSAANLLFLKVPELKSVKNRLHLDLRPPNGSTQAAELDRLLALGATRVDIGQGDVPWHVLADPEGNEFCLLRGTPDEAAARLAAEAASAG